MGTNWDRMKMKPFSARRYCYYFHGISAHPGCHKDKMVNALKAANFLDSLPKDELAPKPLKGGMGLYICTDGNYYWKAKLCSSSAIFVTRRRRLTKITCVIYWMKPERFPGAKADFVVKEQYRNMKEILDLHPRVSAYAKRSDWTRRCWSSEMTHVVV